MKNLLQVFLLFFPLFASTQQEYKQLSLTPMPDNPGNGVTDVWGYYDEFTNKEYALVGSAGLVIMDVTNPKNPIQVAHLKDVDFFDIKTYKNYVYTVKGNENGIGDIIDVSDINNPLVVAHFPNAHNIWIDEEKGVLISTSGITIYDIETDPLNPTKLWEGLGNSHDVMTKDNWLVDFNGLNGTYIYEYSDRANPVLKAHISDPNITYHHSGWLTENFSHLFICDELATGNQADVTVWDVSDLDNISKVKSVYDELATVHNIYVVNNLAYTSYYASGLKIFDVSNPENPQLFQQFDTNGNEKEGYFGNFGVYPFARSKNLFVSDRDSGLYIYSRKQSVDENNGQSVFNVNPNMFQNSFELEIRNQHLREITIQIYDGLGKLVFQKKQENLNGFYIQEFSFPELTNGYYSLRVVSNFGVLEKKLVKL